MPFLPRRQDFTIMFEDNKPNYSVFWLLELACTQLCKISFNSNRHNYHTQRGPPPNELYDCFIYNTMVWGTYVC